MHLKKTINKQLHKVLQQKNTAVTNSTNKEAKYISQRLYLDDKVEQFNQRESCCPQRRSGRFSQQSKIQVN